VLTHKQIQIAEHIKNNFQNVQDSLSSNNLTIIHGDVKSPNIFYNSDNNYEPVFLDWQYVSIGKGVQDLVFFLIESFDIDNIKLNFPIFKNYYYRKLVENGISNYPFAEYETDLKNAVCYFPFFVAIWFGTTPQDELIDKNFPFFFIQKLFLFLDEIMNYFG
jgi:thiamine kinase-like enzyme